MSENPDQLTFSWKIVQLPQEGSFWKRNLNFNNYQIIDVQNNSIATATIDAEPLKSTAQITFGQNSWSFSMNFFRNRVRIFNAQGAFIAQSKIPFLGYKRKVTINSKQYVWENLGLIVGFVCFDSSKKVLWKISSTGMFPYRGDLFGYSEISNDADMILIGLGLFVDQVRPRRSNPH